MVKAWSQVTRRQCSDINWPRIKDTKKHVKKYMQG
jgi:hypothetical protein